MTEIEGNLESIVVENGEITADINNGDIGLNISVETQEHEMSEEVAVNGMKSCSDNDESGSRASSITTLKDDSSKSETSSHTVGGKVRKSSMERLLEETLNTVEHCPGDTNSDVFNDRKSSYSSQGSAGSADSDYISKGTRKTSVYEDKQIEAPCVSRGNIIASRTENLFQNYKRDISYHEPRPMINVNEEIEIDQLKSDGKTQIDLARGEKERELLEIKKQYQQRLLDEERERSEARTKKKEEKLNTSETFDEEDSDVFLERPSSSPSSSRASISSSTSVDEDGAPKRRTSVYEQKQIEAPSSVKGNVIASRTENLMKQYEKDLAGRVAKPMIDLTEGAEVTDETDADTSDLQTIKMQYQQRLLQGEQERTMEKSRRISSGEVNRKPLGAHMNRYIALTKGESVQHSSDEDDEQDNPLYIDKHGSKIERSGGKIEIVKSSDSISNIKNRFGESTQWKKAEVETPSNEVDPTKVKSAMSVFKEKEVKKQETSSFNRPKSKKVRDPKELMELRKKATYGNEEELPEDGVVKKSVIIEKEELDTTLKHHALNVYKNLEKKEDNHLPLHKPKTKLISDVEAQATMEGIRTISSSASEASDINETANDLTVDTVSGYGSAAPCSPSSTLSEDYLSDHKDESPREELKGGSDIICDKESSLNIEVNAELSLDDVSLVKCQAEISSGDVKSENDIEYVGV